MNMEEIVALSVKHNVSDLHLCNAWPARWRRRGKVESAPFTTPDVENLLMCWLSEQQQVQLQEQGQIDFAVTLTDSRRLRASAFVHQQGTSLALRLLPLDCPHLDDLQPPAVIPELLHSENGLILVTGATGSGKSTTLAAMVEYLNQHIEGHILTLEDPIEYRYTSRRCLIQQREVGAHCAFLRRFARCATRRSRRYFAGRAARRGNHSAGINGGGDRTSGAGNVTYARCGAGHRAAGGFLCSNRERSCA